MTGPRLDFNRFDSFANGYEASKQNEYWMKVQGEIMAQMRKDLGLVDDVAKSQAAQAQGLIPPPPKPVSFMDQAQQFFGVGGGVQNSSSEGKARIANVGELMNMPLDELYGRAKALGIENPENMPDQHLRELVAQRRLDVAPDDYNPLRRAANFIALAGIHGAELLTDLESRAGGNALSSLIAGRGDSLPAYMRDVMRQYKNNEGTKEMFGQLEEGVRANRNASELDPFWGGLPGFLGSSLAGAAIGTKMFNGIFAATGRGGVASIVGRAVGSIGRGAIAGGGTSLLFDAGTDKPWVGSSADWSRIVADGLSPEERLQAGANAVFGNRVVSAAVGGVFGALYGRAQKSFPHAGNAADAMNQRVTARAMSGDQPLLEGSVEPDYQFVDETGGRGGGGGVQDAEWQFADEPGAPQNQIGSGGEGQRLLGDGSGRALGPVAEQPRLPPAPGRGFWTGPSYTPTVEETAARDSERKALEDQLFRQPADDTPFGVDNFNFNETVSSGGDQFGGNTDRGDQFAGRVGGAQLGVIRGGVPRYGVSAPVQGQTPGSAIPSLIQNGSESFTQLQATHIPEPAVSQPTFRSDAEVAVEHNGEQLWLKRNYEQTEDGSWEGFVTTRPRTGGEVAPQPTQRPLLALQGPFKPEAATNLAYHERLREDFRAQMNRAEESGNTKEAAVMREMVQLYENEVTRGQTVYAGEKARATASPDDIALKIADLRAAQDHVENAINQRSFRSSGMQYDDVMDAMEDQRHQIRNEILDLKKSAGMDAYGEDPLHWDAFKKNPPAPETPSHRLAELYGTAIRGPQGKPLVTFHGGASVFDDVDVGKTSSGSLAGRGYYVTDTPAIAGGDINPSENERGYAGMREQTMNRTREYLKTDINNLEDSMQLYENEGPNSGINPHEYDKIRQDLADKRTQLAQEPKPQQNVRMQYIAAKKIYDFDGGIDREEAFKILSRAHEMFCELGVTFKDSFDLVNGMTTQTHVNGKLLWDSMGYETGGYIPTARFQPTNYIAKMTPDMVNEVLQAEGYEAIHYMANQRLGSGRYRDAHAWNVFNPRNVIPVFLPEEAVAQQAAALGIQMSNQLEIMGSPALSDMAGNSKFTEADVVIAQIASHPGGITVLRGVADPNALIAKMSDEHFNSSIENTVKSYQFAIRHGRFDLLVSTMGEITPQHIADYQRSGFFEGMDVVRTFDGATGKIIGVSTDGSSVKVQTPKQARLGPGFGTELNTNFVAPFAHAETMIEAPELYDQFKQYAVNETNERVNSSGQFYVADWFDDAVFTRLPDLLQDFLDHNGVADVGVRAALARDFDTRRIEDARQFASQYFDAVDDVRESASAVAEAARTLDRSQPGASEYANMRGFNLIPNVGQPGYVLEDMFSEAKLPMADENSAIEFLHHYTRELPDHTPATPFPMELAEIPNHQPSAPSGPDFFNQMENDIAYFDSDEFSFGETVSSSTGSLGGYDPRVGDPYSGGGGGRVPPRPPATPAAGGAPEPQRRLTQGAEEARTTKAMVAGQLKGLEGRMGDLMHRYNSTVLRLFTPMRSVFSRLEDDLHAMGVTELHPWRDFDNNIAALNKAHDVANPVLNKLSDVLRFEDKFSRRAARSGKWTDMWFVEDPVERLALARKAGMSVSDIRSFHQVDLILEELTGNPQSVAQLKSFIASVRTAQLRGDFSSAAYTGGVDVSGIAHYVEHSMDVGSVFMSPDPRVILPDFIRSFTFAKYAGETWNKSLDTWHAVEQYQDGLGRRPFAAMARITLDWHDFIQRGYQPGPDYVLSSFMNVYNSTLAKLPGGAKISRQEARNIIQVMQTGFYRGQMGLRPHVMLRDAIQPLSAIPYVDASHLFGVFKMWSQGIHSEKFEHMMERSFASGVAERGMPQLESPGVFEGLVTNTNEGGTFTVEQIAERHALSDRYDVAATLLPPGVRGWVKRNLDTLRFYTAQGRWHRIIVGEAAYSKFMTEYTGWQNARRVAIETGQGQVPTFDDFVEATNLRGWGKAEGRAIEDKIGQGDVEGAAHQFMRMVADMTQFGYGARHAPPGLRTTGGRLGSMLGNFTAQQVDEFRNTARGGSLSIIAKKAAVLGLISYGLKKLEDETGWPTFQMNPLAALTFVGGPVVIAGADIYNNLSAFSRAVTNDAQGRPVNSRDIGTVRRISVPGAVGELLGQINPLKGVAYDLEGVVQATQSGNFGNSMARFLTIGNSDNVRLDEENRQRQLPWYEAMKTRTPIPPPPNYRTEVPTVRLPGNSQYQPVQRGDSKSTVDSLMKQFIDQNPQRKQGTHGSGGGAF